MVCSLPSRMTPNFTEVPGAVPLITLESAAASLTGLPSTEAMTSPERTPALAAGPSATGSATSAPCGCLRLSTSAISAVTG